MTSSSTLADVLRPELKSKALVYDISLILGGSLLLALSGQVVFMLPFSPVPVTAQTFAVLLLGALLGSQRGALSVLTYLCQGLAGLPVFAVVKAGPGAFFGPTGGYLMGFVAAAYITGLLAERKWDRRVISSLPVMAVGNLTIYAFGAIWLSVLVGPAQGFTTGVVPFIAGDIIKIVLAAVMLPAGWKLMKSANK